MYTFGKTVTDGTTGNPPGFNTLRTQTFWNEGPATSTQLHNLVVNYTWDVPNGSEIWNNWLTRGLLDGWQLSGDTAFVSGDWAGGATTANTGANIMLSTTDNFNFTGGDVAARPNVRGNGLCTNGNCDPTPGGSGSYFDVSAYSRPSGRGDIGNAPASYYRMPKIVLSNMSIFKNFQLGGGKRIQFRWEAYNVFNQVNWDQLNTTAQFNPDGQQVNAAFGQATRARAPRVMQGAIRFSF